MYQVLEEFVDFLLLGLERNVPDQDLCGRLLLDFLFLL